MLDQLLAANYLQIPCLIDLNSVEVAKRFYCKNNETWTEIKSPEEFSNPLYRE